MIGLDSEKWNDLDDAYGPAVGVPEILRRLYANGTDKDALNDAWSSLCHQGTIYSASVAAVPHLIALTTNLHPKDRLEPLILAGSIAAALKQPPEYVEPDEYFEESLPKAVRLLNESIQFGGPVDHELRYSLGALAAFLGDSKVAKAIFDIDCKNIQCPKCGSEIELS